MNRTVTVRATAALLAVSLLAAGAYLGYRQVVRPTTFSAVFASAPSIYPGDDVRIAGVRVGTITGIRPDGDQAVFDLRVDHGVRIAADAKAVVVAQNLVSARFVALTPSNNVGSIMADGAVIPRERTAVPVEWDEVKEQLTRLATDLGPSGSPETSSIGRFIDSAANAMDGNGAKLRDTISELAGISRVIARGSPDITAMIANLQMFVAVLKDSNSQIVSFQDRLATLTSVLDGSRTDLDAALTNLSEAVGKVRDFVAGSRDQTTEQVRRLLNVTQNLVDHQDDLEQVLHVAPTALANSYNMMDPRTGGASGVFTLNNLANPSMFFCTMISALSNVTAGETGKLCNQYLGPALDKLNLNYLPFPFNPILTAVPSAGKLIYTDPKLMPGGSGTTSPPMALNPQDSAYQPIDLPGLLLPAGTDAPAALPPPAGTDAPVAPPPSADMDSPVAPLLPAGMDPPVAPLLPAGMDPPVAPLLPAERPQS